MPHALSLAALLGAALLLSGGAGLINQVIWQRGLKVFLGGSETISSMTVVLVFMAGLGIGSIWMGRRVERLADPLRRFALFEGLLALLTLGICAVLASDLSDSVFAVQNAALAIGVPLLILYAAGAALMLIVPCLVMGATMPLAAAVCQRRLQCRDSRVLGWLFFVNTLGSVGGAVVASGHLLPLWGQSRSLVVAAALNLGAAALLVLLAARLRQVHTPTADGVPPDAAVRSARSPEHILAFGLGFCSLAYEMYLFRLIAWRHEPLPFTFAAVLTGFLLFWSLGAALSTRWSRLTLSAALRGTALACVASIPVMVIDRPADMAGIGGIAGFVASRAVYFVPCIGFGFLFSRVAAAAARRWGHDVGRVYAWNTAGSCLGIVTTTFVGYEMPFFMMVLLLALLLSAMQEYHSGVHSAGQPQRRWRGPLLAALGVAVLSFTVDLSRVMPGIRIFYGRDGVIGIDDEHNLVWDGLWHSRLSDGRDHIGTNNWYLAVAPVIAHGPEPIEDVCVIGVATGITVSTLARLDSVRHVDGYDITRTLRRVYAAYPEGTLHVADNPKVDIIWQDARSGLALHPDRRYDLVQTQPLYLKQAGSSILNSVEFFELVAARLKPGGVFCLYSNGTPEQALVIRRTAAQVFAHGETFFDGYLLVLSNDPIDLTPATLERRFATADPLWDEIRGWHVTANPQAIRDMLDEPRLDWGQAGDPVVTDDHPVVEYPTLLPAMMGARRTPTAMPPGARQRE